MTGTSDDDRPNTRKGRDAVSPLNPFGGFDPDSGFDPYTDFAPLSGDDLDSDYAFTRVSGAIWAEMAYHYNVEAAFTFAPQENGLNAEFWESMTPEIYGGMSTLWAEHAFIIHWGTADELAEKAEELGARLDWWSERQTDGDVEAVQGLQRAHARLLQLHDVAAAVEENLRLRGYAPHPESRLLVELRTSQKGPKRALLSECVVRVFAHLVAVHGWPREKTEVMQQEICVRLEGKFDPALLKKKVRGAINSHLHPERDRKRRKKRGQSRTKGS